MGAGQPAGNLTAPTAAGDEIIRDFLVESNEALDGFDRDLLALEKDGSSRELLDRIFRAVHTIKGTGGALGYGKLVALSHLGESVLSRMREGSLQLSPAIATALLAMADALRRMLEQIGDGGTEVDTDSTGALRQLSRLLEEARPAAFPAMPNPVSASPPALDPDALPRLGEILVISEVCKTEHVRAAIELQQQGDPRLLGEILVATGSAARAEVAEGLKLQSEHRDIASNTIRVDVALLDSIMELTGELAALRSDVLELAATRLDGGFRAAARRLDLIAAALQQAVMRTRMQPIASVWSKLPRMVRDLSLAYGKRVEIQMHGAETELDRTIIEAIKDPLTHIIRNAVDHGIEVPRVRIAAGKSPEGQLVLRAFHQAGRVHIEVADDGAGVDCEKLLANAVAGGLITAAQTARLTPREVLNLIFVPGLTTAGQVSNISGRGVGMDVVRTNIGNIGGVVEVASSRGRGTLLKIAIPVVTVRQPRCTPLPGCGAAGPGMPPGQGKGSSTP